MTRISTVLLTSVLSIASATMFAEPQSYLDMDNGYKWYRVTSRVFMNGPVVSLKQSSQVLKHINTYQLGGRGQWTFYDTAFIRASGHYGWTWDGRYKEATFKGNAKGHTYDVDGALGYYFCVYDLNRLVPPPDPAVELTKTDKRTPSLWIAPIFGWSFDSLNVKGENMRAKLTGEQFNNLNNINARQQLNGPFLGVDILFQLKSFTEFLFAYEFHYASWHGNRIIKGADYGHPPFGYTTGFSNKRHMNGVVGNVFKLTNSYTFSDTWKLGAELKYQFYSGDNGKYKQTKTPISPLITYKEVNQFWWLSFGMTIFVGGVF